MSSDLDLIMVHPSEGADTYAIYSPQLPGFTAGSDSALQLQQDLPDALRFAGVQVEKMKIHQHAEYPFTSEEGIDYVIRVAVDEYQNDRVKAADVFTRAMTDKAQRERLDDEPRTLTGDILFICAVPSDHIEDIARQLDPSGDVAVILVAVAEEMVWSSNFTNSGELLGSAKPLDHWNLTASSTVADVMRNQTGRPHQSVLVPS